MGWEDQGRREHGWSDVLADRPGAFERLAKASAERERLINEECERLHALAHPNGPGVVRPAPPDSKQADSQGAP